MQSKGSPKSKDNKYPVKSLIKALNILDFLGASEAGESLTAISDRLRLGKSTVHRLLATLRDQDFVWLDPSTSNYVLGAKILQFSDQLSRQSILVRYGGPALATLAKNTNETCNLGVLEGAQVLYLIKKESENPLRMSGQVGKRLPAHCTALGKVMLSSLSQEEFDILYSRSRELEAPSPTSVASVAELVRQLQKVRQTGVAFDNEELYAGVVCIAAAVRDYRGRVIAAVSVSFPKHRMDPGKLEEFKRYLLSCTNRLSEQLGYQSPMADEVPA